MGILEDIKNKKVAKENLKKDLAEAQTLKDFFTICEKHFDVQGTKLQGLAKNSLINNLDKIIDATGAKPKIF